MVACEGAGGEVEGVGVGRGRQVRMAHVRKFVVRIFIAGGV